jgi:hypothetical protein
MGNKPIDGYLVGSLAKFVVILLLLINNNVYAENWISKRVTDPMTEDVYAIAYSPKSKLISPTASQSSETRAYIVYQCDGDGQQTVSVNFNQPRYLTETELDSSGETFYTRIKWDSELTEQRMIHRYGTDQLLFARNENQPFYNEAGERRATYLQNLQQHENVLVEFPMFNASALVMEFNLNDSASAIDEARRMCRR